ncbi:MAG: PorT family protein [Chitinophagaceae bacterium]|nr:PorT family protein [Chitinophagaceae bacterium]
MKKVILLLAVVTFIGFSAKAQTSATFGFKAGMTGSNMKFSGSGMSISMTTKVGFYAGAMADIGISENFGIQPELYYSMMGAKSGNDPEFGNGKVDLSYGNLPILFKYKSEGFSAFLGPQIGVLFSAKDKESGGPTVDIKNQFKSTDFSGIIGAGYTLTNGFGFDARYQLGFTNVGKGSDLQGVTVKNNGFMVGVHYFFNKGAK